MNLKIVVQHPDLSKLSVRLTSGRRCNIVRFALPMQNKGKQKLAGLSVCGAPNRDCKPR